MITSLKPEGKNFIGEAKIMDTPYGKIVKGLIDEGAQLGVSSRGMGSLVTKNGANYVGKDFYLATAADIVADPSAPDAFVEGIMESKEWVWENGKLVERDIEAWKRQIREAKQRKLDEKRKQKWLKDNPEKTEEDWIDKENKEHWKKMIKKDFPD